MFIVDFTVLAFRSTTDTVPEPLLATYSHVRSGEYAIPAGFTPKRTLVMLAVAARGPGFAEVCGGRLYPSCSPPSHNRQGIIGKIVERKRIVGKRRRVGQTVEGIFVNIRQRPIGDIR
jgi:hypothetical protein